MANELQLAAGLKLTNPAPADAYYVKPQAGSAPAQPYADPAEACAFVPQALRYQGMRVFVTGIGRMSWSTTDLSDAGLLPDATGGAPGLSTFQIAGVTTATYTLGQSIFGKETRLDLAVDSAITLPTPTAAQVGQSLSLRAFAANGTGYKATISARFTNATQVSVLESGKFIKLEVVRVPANTPDPEWFGYALTGTNVGSGGTPSADSSVADPVEYTVAVGQTSITSGQVPELANATAILSIGNAASDGSLSPEFKERPTQASADLGYWFNRATHTIEAPAALFDQAYTLSIKYATGVVGGLALPTRDAYDVPTAKALQVIADYQSNGGPFIETDETYYGCVIIDDYTQSPDEFKYECSSSRPASTGGVTAWKWRRYLEAGV